MYESLGDPSLQQSIRESSPDLPHCKLLLRDPSACDGCDLKLNPFENKETGSLARARHEYSEIAFIAEDLVTRSEVGYPIPIQDISEDELSAMKGFRLADRYRLISAISNLVSSMFAKAST